MSDGPHRSLPMKVGWKRLAERCDKTAFSSEEISTAIILALRQDCQDELSAEFLSDIRAVFLEQNQNLFKDALRSRLEALRDKAGCGIGRILLDAAIQQQSGDVGEIGTLVAALNTALADRAARCSRQVEEHYLRKSTAPRANNVRLRIEQAIVSSSFESLARQILKLDNRKLVSTSLKLRGIEDGVSLR